jgi:hypothetical protein
MTIKLKSITDNWKEIKDAAMTTIGMESGKEPDSEWKRRALLSEHSMIRKLRVVAKWYRIKYWVSVHIARHWLGIIHFVSTQRTDRTGTDRNKLEQDAPVNHEIDVNAQALINISRKRLCRNASTETQHAWRTLLNTFRDKEPELFSVCVPDCIYRSHCYEFNSCGWYKTPTYKKKLKQYREGVR